MDGFMRNQINSTKERRSDLLRRKSHEFCQALVTSPENPLNLIQRYFIPEGAKITEHGPQWCTDRLPFLAKTFREISGDDSCETYFKLLSDTLKMHMTKYTFPASEAFLVDADAVVEREDGRTRGAVSVVAQAKFESVKTGKSWEEEFIYKLSGFDDVGRIGHWEIWADPLSAWVAVTSCA
ncbi:hypothetical protein BLS_006079 [Venturia inaequalis]|uniref:Uncharacterized protein n=1 Tax=Venturia inaequalis TaxID=5025 RepID=A0A8H3Z777_VENIN|nr:hypothetical protein BLS_006079 [Venturia inaequalis]KAE9985703.1 hypothetical protein EG327_004624 [Venturia inaequalis]KAE9987076.1 hypothetical protein EG328_003858 [Venturia inaequalis]RDI80254.1 hypothetical protein Vi05172_g9722 [Venturia inaequalis]